MGNDDPVSTFGACLSGEAHCIVGMPGGANLDAVLFVRFVVRFVSDYCRHTML